MAIKTIRCHLSIVFLDRIVFKVRKDSRIINKCVYSVLGIDIEGKRDM